MEKEEFKEIFKTAMSKNMAHSDTTNSRGEVITNDFEIEPKCVIRDFDVDVTEMQQTGIWDTSKIDEEFDDFDEAWEYLKGLRTFRLMANNGIILYDNYSKEA